MDIKSLLKSCMERQASDLHLLPNKPPLMRIHGELNNLPDHPALSSATTKQLIYDILTPEHVKTFERDLLLDMALTIPELGNFRVSVLHQLFGIAAVIRIIPHNIPTFDDLRLPPILKRLLGLPHGLILIAGPTGSGKSTTLAAMVEYINLHRAAHIITIEDPIEFVYEPKHCAITQLQVGRDTHDFTRALRASLRQDPDVVLLSEVRDLETIRLALTAAETGHLVMATLHASSAPFAISRVVDVFTTGEKNRVRNLLAETLQAVICQTLVKRVNNAGRVAAFEIMLGTPAIRHLIRQDMGSHMESTMQTNGDIGMCTFDQYLQELVAKRLISLAEARAVEADLNFNKQV